jgi:hypothetical protein
MRGIKDARNSYSPPLWTHGSQIRIIRLDTFDDDLREGAPRRRSIFSLA